MVKISLCDKKSHLHNHFKHSILIHTAVIKVSPQGHLTKMVSTDKAVKQGCILAPLLFNIYINDMAQFLYNSDFHPLKLADTSHYYFMQTMQSCALGLLMALRELFVLSHNTVHNTVWRYIILKRK